MTTWRSCWGFIWWHWTYNRSYSIICLWFSLVHRGHFHLACWKNKSVPKIIFYNSCIAETQAWAVLKTSHHLRFCQFCRLITVYSDKIYTSLTMSNDERKHLSNDERKHFSSVWYCFETACRYFGLGKQQTKHNKLFSWCLITTWTITVNHAHKPKWKIIGLIRHFVNIPHLGLHTVEQDEELHGLLAVAHKLRICFTVLTGAVAPPTRGKPNQWAHSCLRGVWKTLVCLSQRPCAMDPEEGCAV